MTLVHVVAVVRDTLSHCQRTVVYGKHIRLQPSTVRSGS